MTLKNKYRGKVITLVGSPAAGKTYLGNILKDELDAIMLYEHPESGFPKQIQSNLENQENLFETILFFRNIQIENHLKAIELTKENNTVILDTPFYQNQLFIELYIEKQFSRDILYQLGNHDLSIYSSTDVTLYIATTTKLVKEYLNKRHGERSWEKDLWYNFISKMPPKVDAHINNIQGNINNLIRLERELYDFSKNNDKEKLFKLLNEVNL